MDRDLIIIGSYPKEKEVIEVLKSCIKQLNDKYDTLLVSHYPVDSSIQELVTYCIYDRHNDLIHNPSTFFYMDYPEYYIQTNFNNRFGSNAYSVLTSIMNGISLIKDKYTHFFYIEGDGIIATEDICKLDLLKEICISKNKGAFFFTGTEYFYTLLFFSNTKFFIDNVVVPKTSKEYLNRLPQINSHGALENYLYHSFKEDDIYTLETSPKNYFNNSIIGALDFSSGKVQKKDYAVDLVKHKTSDNIFFIYSNTSPTPENKKLNVTIDNNYNFTLENNNYSMYLHIVPSSDVIKLQINNTVIEYNVKDIINNLASYIDFK
jgi:hypothetical protein